ncbi:hypothetical protein EG328_009059 [Venturia inaequalis]|uniref:Uncharacterized protein n=1 Tax=Venturia inaequalis TaxID=5025 RepID=A0A8H3VA76_VENIN|nr:hypothetical protein EG328_009059 [Venturia inaequalis]
MPKVKNAPATKDASWSATIMGKKGHTYTMEECQRILQEKNVLFKKADGKADLVKKLHDCAVKHGLKKKDRLDILMQALHVQHIRWQVLDGDGEFAAHAYPSGFTEKITGAIEQALAKDEARRLGQNSQECRECKVRVSELNFPTSMGQCCGRASNFCRNCIENHLRQEVELVVSQHGSVQDINCLMCQKAHSAEDVKSLASRATWKNYNELAAAEMVKKTGLPSPAPGSAAVSTTSTVA